MLFIAGYKFVLGFYGLLFAGCNRLVVALYVGCLCEPYVFIILVMQAALLFLNLVVLIVWGCLSLWVVWVGMCLHLL